VFLLGAIGFLLNFSFPSPPHPSWSFTFLNALWYVGLPWYNWLSLGGLVLLGGIAGVGYFTKHPHTFKVFVVAAIIAILLTVFFGLSVTQNTTGDNSPNPTMPPSNNWFPNDSPTTPSPTATPYPTTDPNDFVISQRLDTEYVSSYYWAPTSYQAEPMITSEYYYHAVSIAGTYNNWSYDVYVQTGSLDAFWVKCDSGVTDADGNGAVYVPFSYSDAGLTLNVVAVLNPDGDVPVDYGGFTAGEMTALIADGTLRASNTLPFYVVYEAVL